MTDAKKVYFLRPVGRRGPVKIGCTVDVPQRLKTYCSWSPTPLEVAAQMPGDHMLERRLHTLFIAHHSHHEWFHACDEIDAVIDAIREGRFDPSILPQKTKRLYLVPVKPWTPERKFAHGLCRRVRRVLETRGLKPTNTPHIYGSDFAKLDPLEFAEARAALEAFLANPELHGSVPDWPWVKDIRRRWLSTAREAA